MDEKTEELRDIFEEVTGEDTVTEEQEETPGSLAGSDEDVEAGLAEIVARMREKYAFDADLTDEEYAQVARGYYEGESDTDLAEELSVDRREVVRARLDIHLVRDRDLDAPFDLSDLRDLLAEDLSTSEVADELDVSPSTVRRYRRVVETENEIRSVSSRFQAEFEDVLTNAGISHSMTEGVKKDGLEDATEGAEAESDMSL
jgi:predicted DNA-binding protein YlxM (UPF0122 family)